MERYAVFGNPIGHSLSPGIHQHFARQCGQSIHYQAILAPLDGFAQSLADFFAQGGQGCNVTVPFKQEAYRLCGALTQRAERAGAVNTLIRQASGKPLGDNTDGVGLLRDLTQNLGLSLNNQRILLLGAGGAARGVLEPLLAANPAELVIANRSLDKAQNLLNEFAALGNLRVCGFTDLSSEQPFDLIINATSASLGGQLPPLPDGLLRGQGACYDILYSQTPTVFQQWASGQGAAVNADGLGMLVEQAAEAFFLWRGIRPDSREVLKALRQSR